MKYLWAGAFSILSFALQAQTQCGQHVLEQQLRESDQNVESAFQEFNNWISEAQYQGAQRADLYIVPVVFHIIHQNGPENITDEQVYDAMRIINTDYRAENAELDDIVSAFVPIIGKADIEFRLAQIDPNGQATNGIDRIESSETFVGDDGSKLNPWPRNKYLNIWVTDAISVGGAAAYAYRPPSVANSNAASIDGIISNHRYVGSIGTASYAGSKTLSHEIGHYLGLSHTWGPTNEPGIIDNCDVDDGISDTPNTIGVGNSSCNLTQNSCGSLDNVQNIMDYASCESMFTKGQINVMRASLASSVAQRNQLVTASNLAATGVLNLSAGGYFAESQTVCRNEVLKLYDESKYAAETWNWTISNDFYTYTSTDENPEITMVQPGIFDLELTVTKGTTSKTFTQEKAISVVNPTGKPIPFYEDFEEVDYGWFTDEHEVYNDNHRWAPFTEGGNGDDFSYRMYNIDAVAQSVHDLIFSGVDMRPLSNFELSFDIAYNRFSPDDDDKLQVFLSNDCGSTWKQVFLKSGSQLANNANFASHALVPTSSDFMTFTINNAPISWVGANTLFMFRFTSHTGNNIYIDNVNIDGNYKTEAFLVYPGNGDQGVPMDTKLDWLFVNNASTYTVELDTDPNFGSAAKQSYTITAQGNSSLNDDTKQEVTGLTQGQTYYWRAKSNNSDWSETWSFRVTDNGVGIVETKVDEIKLYPNPTSNRIFLSGEIDPTTKVQITSLAGQVLFTSSLNFEQSNAFVDVSSLSSGVYFISLLGEQSTITKQFIKSE